MYGNCPQHKEEVTKTTQLNDDTSIGWYTIAKRIEHITVESLSGLYRHHPYLLLFQKEDWRDYLVLLAEIYDLLEEQSARVPIEAVRSIAMRFYSHKSLGSPDAKVTSFFTIMIGELQVLKDSHDQFGQRYLEATRSGKTLLQFIESLVNQRNKFSGTGAETLLGALNDILISRGQMTDAEALEHHKEKIEAYRDDIVRIKKEGLGAAQLLPMAHSNEALFVQAEDAAIHVLQSIEDVKAAIEDQRKELASGYFQKQRSAGETLGAVADFYDSLYTSPSYVSYIQAKELLSHLEGFEARFTLRNVDRLLHSIEARELLPHDQVKRSNLRSFMHQFAVADVSIQDKIKSQLRMLQQQVLYAVSTDVEGLRVSLHDLLSKTLSAPDETIHFWETQPIEVNWREAFEPGEVQLFDFEIPAEIKTQEISEESFDLAQERELFLALLRAEEGTLKDILDRLHSFLSQRGELRSSQYTFQRGLAEYYVLSEIDLFTDAIEKHGDGMADTMIEFQKSQFVLRRAPSFILRRKVSHTHGKR